MLFNDGDRVVYHYPADDEYYFRIGGVWYKQTGLSDYNVGEDIKSGYAEKI